MKEYLTGASGFVGSRLAESLAAPDVIPHDKISVTTIEPFDRFFFLSTYGNMSFHEDDDRIIKANLLDLVDMATQASRFEFKSFVYTSTSSVRLERQTMYSRTKRAAEEVLLSLMEKHNQPFAIIRPYSVTGVGEQPQHLIPALIRSCLEGEQIPFVEEPVHDFIDVDDVVSAILNISSAGAKGIFEVGNGKGYTNKEVLDIVEGVTRRKANITKVKNLRDYDTKEWVCRNYRARSFGWAPKKTLQQSVIEMVEDYERNRTKSN